MFLVSKPENGRYYVEPCVQGLFSLSLQSLVGWVMGDNKVNSCVTDHSEPAKVYGLDNLLGQMFS